MSYKEFMSLVISISMCGAGLAAGMGKYDTAELLLLLAILLAIQRDQI